MHPRHCTEQLQYLVCSSVCRHLRCVFLSFSNRLLQNLLQLHSAHLYLVCTNQVQHCSAHHCFICTHKRHMCVTTTKLWVHREHILNVFLSEQNLLPSPPTALTTSASYPTSQSTSVSSASPPSLPTSLWSPPASPSCPLSMDLPSLFAMLHK